MTDTTYLERALIGALLNEPHNGPGLPTLTQRDFTDPLCQALWHVLCGDTRWPPGPVNVNDIAERLTSLGAQLHPNRRSAAAVAELQTRAPARAHPHAYAQLIIHEATRCDVLNLGYQLTQIDPTQPAQAITTIDAIPAQLQTHRARSPLGAGTPPAADPTHSPTDADDRPLSRPETTDEQQWGAEYATLGAAIHDHPRGSRAHVQACIVLDDFTRPDIRAGWQAVEQLQTIGLPVDEITVHWQLTHCATSGQRIPSLTMLRDSRQAASTHHEAVHTLTTASATRAITRLHTTLQALQTDQRPLAQTIDAITTSTQDVRCQTHRIESTACHQ